MILSVSRNLGVIEHRKGIGRLHLFIIISFMRAEQVYLHDESIIYTLRFHGNDGLALIVLDRSDIRRP